MSIILLVLLELLNPEAVPSTPPTPEIRWVVPKARWEPPRCPVTPPSHQRATTR